MKNQATKSLVVACIAIIATACAGETLVVNSPEQVDIQNNLALSNGEISKRDSDNSAIQLQVSLSQDTVLVEDFSELTISEEFLFSDTQEASVETSNDGLYVVEKVSYRDYSLEEYSANRRKVTLNFRVDYTYDGEKRDTILSPWYFQETPLEIKPSTPVDVVTYVPREEVTFLEGKVKVKFLVDRYVNEEVDTTYFASAYVAEVGSLYSMEVHAINSDYSRKDSVVEGETSDRKVKDFTLTSTTRTYKYETFFTTAAGGKVSPQNEVRFDLVEKVVFENDEYSYTWTFKGGNAVKRAEIVDNGKDGKMIEGTYSPYIGSFELEVESTLFSAQVDELSNAPTFHSSTAVNNIYQRESVVD